MQLFKSAFVVSSLTILSRISGFARDIAIASKMGAGYYADIFFAAFKIANFLRKLLAEGTFFAAFVPSFSKVLQTSSKAETIIFISKVFSISLYFIAIITIVAEIFMPELTTFMTPGFSGYKLFETINLSKIIFVYFFFIALTSILCSILNSVGKFFYYASIPIMLNITMLCFIYFWGDSFKNLAYCLAYAVLAAGIIQFGIALLACFKEGYTPKLWLPKKQLASQDVKHTFKNILPSMIGGGLTQINTFVDLALGSLIASGVSYLYYADRIFFLPTSVIGTSLGVIILPILARKLAAGENPHETISKSIVLACIFAFPAAAVLISIPEVICKILFERGAFVHENTIIVGNVLKILGVAMPFCILNKVLSSVFFGFSKPKIPMYISIASVSINVIASIYLVHKIGIYGIVCGAAVSYFISFSAGCLFLKRVSGFGMSKPILFTTIKILAASAAVGALTWFSCNTEAFINSAGFTSILYFTILGIASCVLYVGMLIAMRINFIALIKE